MDVEDDSDNDSDYKPGKDDELDDTVEVEAVKKVSEITDSRKRKMDTVFADMQAEDQLSTQNTMAKALNSKPKREAKETKSSKNKKLLESIFGKSQAELMISKTKTISVEENNVVCDQVKAAVGKIKRKQTVSEKLKFAGKEIIVERTVIAASQDTNASMHSAKPASALDAMLDTLKGPKVISTVVKSSSDWNNFKDKEGLEDELAAATKDGFLTRKEFLERCDVRAFEQERDARLRGQTAEASLSSGSS